MNALTSLRYTVPHESTMPNWANYLLLALLFFGIIILGIAIIMFAKWLTVGPKLKHRSKSIANKITGKKSDDGISVKGGEVIENQEFLNEINKKIENAETPQELLELQIEKENYEKSKLKAQEEIKAKEEAKLKKINDKEERARISKESKEKSKELREKEKQKKIELKEQKNKEKEEKK